MNTEPVDEWTLHQQALRIADNFIGIITDHLNRLSRPLVSVLSASALSFSEPQHTALCERDNGYSQGPLHRA